MRSSPVSRATTPPRRALPTPSADRSDWRDFTTWCDQLGLQPLPVGPDTVVLYLTSLAPTKKTSPRQRRLSAISQTHQVAGHDSPTRSAAVRLVWAGIRRTHGTAQEGKSPTLAEDVRQMVAATAPRRRGQDWRLLDLHDRALLLRGFAGAFRRSELVGLDVADLEFSRAGLVVRLRRSRTDQERQRRKIGAPRGQCAETCPLVALQTYLEVADIEIGPLFRGANRHGQLQGRPSDRAVALVINRRVEAVGFDPERFADHSLRAGLATSAGASERAIANQTGHKSLAVLGRYIRDGDLFHDNAAAVIDL